MSGRGASTVVQLRQSARFHSQVITRSWFGIELPTRSRWPLGPTIAYDHHPMVWSHRGVAIPLHVWHGVPSGWREDEIRAQHRLLRGTFDLCGPEVTEPGAPDWMPDRRAWLQYREMLYRIADGITAGDSACVELAIRFVELHHIGSYGGYVRSKFARRLKRAELAESQRRRLHEHFYSLLAQGERVYEFEDYLPLWRQVATAAQWEHVRDRFGPTANAWLRSRLFAID